MIPKKIYYIWLGGTPLSLNIKNNIESWKVTNPDYDIVRIDETNFDISKYCFIEDAYNSKNWAFASDLIRLVTIYENGGFYFDTDVKLLKSLDPFLKYKSIWGMETPGLINSGLIIGAEKKDKHIGNIINVYQELNFDPDNIYDFVTTQIISNYFTKYGLKINNRLQVLDDYVYIFPSDYFAPLHWWGGGHITKRTVAIQQYSKNWGDSNRMSNSGKFVRNFYHHFPKTYLSLKKIKDMF
ncbi:glycosyltransferase family 32 protein [Limosilactobacillus walteri]|uniref:Glycosyl transferase n=1 Tax=Limosilactobacillus walteri TaxID=2268022 RepID=A0ABR8P8S0_9LACO|nr:glycosyltransferase [Limosilactobacillus walteri]MBD5807113.1 glycosyl transferase [Limosilactobacillus walteri]